MRTFHRSSVTRFWPRKTSTFSPTTAWTTSAFHGVLGKIRVGALVKRLATRGRHDNTSGRAIFPQGGSTITQQLVRGDFLQRQTSQENSYQLRNVDLVPRV